MRKLIPLFGIILILAGIAIFISNVIFMSNSRGAKAKIVKVVREGSGCYPEVVFADYKGREHQGIIRSTTIDCRLNLKIQNEMDVRYQEDVSIRIYEDVQSKNFTVAVANMFLGVIIFIASLKTSPAKKQ